MKFLFISTILLSVLTTGQTHACTLKIAQDQFSTLNKLFQIYHRERSSYTKRGLYIPGDLSAKQLELSKASADIRQLFAIEVAKKSDMKASDPIDAKICHRFDMLMTTHAPALKNQRVISVILPDIEPEKETQPACHKNNIRKRFGIAVRQQRKLTIAGKINKKEQIAYLKIATKFVRNAKNDFEQACKILHEYEKHLANEKADERGG